ncbi:hypothetical protein [uncultured Rhodoblastus sp.]|uniref:hypothetical protein n=1 Tax=uncultured Rhodoblastus sp. TaxID=543037 RepID=UPI0025D83050|nr:hypothetical protein [uncultured Rhodoblastus sp.]
MNAGKKPDLKASEAASGVAGEDVKAGEDNALASNAVDAVRKAVEELTELLRGHGPEAASALKEAGKAAGEHIDDLAHDLKDEAGAFSRARLEELSAAVRKNPLAALSIAVGVGLIVGLWNNRGGRS